MLLVCYHIVSGQHQFTNNGNFRIHGNTQVSFYGNLINNGTFVDSGNVITLKGNSVQKIGGTANTKFKNLTLDNNAGSQLTANESITGELTISAGTFSSNGFNFTLISDAKGTARIAPIQGNFSGNIVMQRYVTGPTSWRFLAAPVTGAKISDWQDDFVTSGFPGSTYPNFNFVSVYGYDETIPGTLENGYLAPGSSSNQIVPGNGYWCYMGPTPITVDVTGPPVKFNHNFNVSFTQSAGEDHDGWTMIGNPYPSTIDWDSPAWTKTNVNGAINIWNPERQQYSSYVSGLGTNGGSNFIASSQAFWIQTNAANPVLIATEQVKSGTQRSFMKNSQVFEKLKLTLSGNGFKDEAYVRFGPAATFFFDLEFDARKVFSDNPSAPGLSTIDSTGKDLSINSLPYISNSIRIPVKTITGLTGTYSLTLENDAGTFASYCLVLQDLYSGFKTKLSGYETYTFTLSDTTHAPRFVISVTRSPDVHVTPATCYESVDGDISVAAHGTGPWHYVWLNNQSQAVRMISSNHPVDTIHGVSPGDYVVNVAEQNSGCAMQSLSVHVTSPAPLTASFIVSKDTIYLEDGDSLTVTNASAGFQTTILSVDNATHTANFTHLKHRFTSRGIHRVKLVAQSGACSDSLSKSIYVLERNPTETQDLHVNVAVRVFPSPGDGLFYIESPGRNRFRFTVITSAGSQVFGEYLEGPITTIDLRSFSKGVYFYRIEIGNQQTSSGKLVIQ